MQLLEEAEWLETCHSASRGGSLWSVRWQTGKLALKDWACTYVRAHAHTHSDTHVHTHTQSLELYTCWLHNMSTPPMSDPFTGLEFGRGGHTQSLCLSGGSLHISKEGLTGDLDTHRCQECGKLVHSLTSLLTGCFSFFFLWKDLLELKERWLWSCKKQKTKKGREIKRERKRERIEAREICPL